MLFPQTTPDSVRGGHRESQEAADDRLPPDAQRPGHEVDGLRRTFPLHGHTRGEGKFGSFLLVHHFFYINSHLILYKLKVGFG
jgi:hypothetical protein